MNMRDQIQQAITDAEESLDEIGNGYGWTVELSVKPILEIFITHFPQMNIEDFKFAYGEVLIDE